MATGADMRGPGVVWRGPLTDPSGYAAGGRAFVRGLHELGVPLRIEPQMWNPRQALTREDRALLGGLLDAGLPRVDARVEHTFPPLADLDTPAPLRVIRTMFETDRIPESWVAPCNRADEVWVPTEHNAEAFAAAGVDPHRLVIVPEPFELDRLHRDAPPLALPGAHGTVFLAAFDFSLRKGWDVLIDAWCATFSAHDDVTLVLKVWSTTAGMGPSAIHAAIGARITALGHDPARVPDIVVVDDLLSPEAMAGLYAACHVYVAPTRGEGWGRPILEAMAMGRPAIATAWSGPAAFVDPTVGWPIGFEVVPVPPEALAEVPSYAGHEWAEPDAEDLGDALHDAHRSADARRTRGAAAAHRAACFDHRRVAAAALERLALGAGAPR
jgi:glycosyltransferase involved in cell wall biosynthesis